MHTHRLRRVVLLSFATGLLGACSQGPTALPRRDLGVILGEWRYASVPMVREAPSLNTGLRVTIIIDSLDAMQVRGRVGLWFAGDVGVRPDAFGPVTGSLHEAGAVTIRIPFTAPGSSGITIVGTVNGDVLTISESLVGAEPGPFPSGGCFEPSPS
ncbi:MAG: hypothetical protein WD773_09430 [Gemmatimonadales bacterium]